MRISIHPAGRVILISGLFLFFLISAIIVCFVDCSDKFIFLLGGIGCIYFSFLLYFFRNPKRELVLNSNIVYAPADGKIVLIEDNYEQEFLKEKCIKVSIFMSMLNVHVNRYPVSGVIKYTKYHPGRYYIAYYPKASEFNEHQSTAIETLNGQVILIKQIAGIIARRIVCYANPGNEAVQGDDIGFIKFGSRVDLFLPLGTDIVVKKGETVKGNSTIIGYIN